MLKEAQQKNNKVLVKASARYLHIAPRKMRLMTGLVKNMNVGEAITQLSHLNKKAASMLIKVLKSAVANAKNNFSLSPEKLYIRSIVTDMGRAYKRYSPRARGSAFVIRKKTAHVNVMLEERERAKPTSSKFTFLKKKAEEKPAPVSIDQETATSQKEEKTAKKQYTVKTDEQRKMGTIQQKRRLFDRRGGE